MNRAVLLKSLRDGWLLITLLTLSVVLFEFLAVRMLVEAVKDLELLRVWLDRPIIKFFIRLALGADLAGELTPTTMSTMLLGHPLLYALAWTLLLTLCSAAVAGEIGRGTADLLLTLPVSRARVFVSTSAVSVLAAVLVSWAPLAGLWLGERVFALQEPLDFTRLWRVSANFLALNLSIAGVTMLASSVVSRRGVAVGVVLAGLLISDLVNFLSQFWEAIKPISFLGFLYYYRPLMVVYTQELPVRNICVLLAVALVAWLLGLWCFSRRDIPAA